MFRRPSVLAATLLLLVAQPLSAAITVTERLAEAQTADNDASWTSVGTFSIANGSLGICAIANSDTPASATPTLTGGSVTTWTLIASQGFNSLASPTQRITVFYGLGSGAGAAAITADFVADNQTNVSFNCFELTDTITTGTNGADAIAQFKVGTAETVTTLTATFDNALEAAQVVIFAAGTGAAETWTADTASGFSVGTEISNTIPTSEQKTEYLVNGADNAPLWTFGNNADAAGIAIEILEDTGAPAASSYRSLLGVGR